MLGNGGAGEWGCWGMGVLGNGGAGEWGCWGMGVLRAAGKVNGSKGPVVRWGEGAGGVGPAVSERGRQGRVLRALRSEGAEGAGWGSWARA